MDSLNWSSEMSLDIPALDLAHQRFLLKLSDIASAPDSEFNLKYFSLIEELERDFKEEEDLMEAMQFYEIHPHREQHARVLYALHKVIPAVLRGEYDTAKQTLELIPKWFLFHLSAVDKLVSIWFKLKNAGVTVDTWYDEQNSVVPPFIRPGGSSPVQSATAGR